MVNPNVDFSDRLFNFIATFVILLLSFSFFLQISFHINVLVKL